MTDKERIKRCAVLAEEEAKLWANFHQHEGKWNVVHDLLCAALKGLNRIELRTYNNCVRASGSNWAFPAVRRMRRRAW